MSVKSFARAYGFRQVKSEKDRLVLKGAVHTVILYRDSRRSLVNGSLVWLNEPLVRRQKDWMLHERDVRLTLVPLLRPSDALAGLGSRIVVLDPGHGGEDSGAVSPKGLLEKDVALDISRRVRNLLARRGVKVYLTRHDDRFLELEERPRRAGKWKADVFVSVHANAGASTAKGTETFALSIPGSHSTNHTSGKPAPKTSSPGNRHNEANVALAYALHHSLMEIPGTTDRGVKRARFSVLRNATCPAALVEVGFLSHPGEGEKFRDAAHRERVARSIARGIDNYLRAVKKAALNAEPNQKEN